LLLGLAASQANATPPQASLNGNFHEAVQEEVAVSGSVVVGVAAASALSGDAALAGLMIPAAAESVCLTVLSRDGVYYSRNSYRIPTDAAGDLVVLPYSNFTNERERIRRYPAGDLAVRAMPGGCEESPAVYLVPTTGNPADTVDILVNAFGANDVYFRAPDGTEADCEEFAEGRRTSYDYHCKVPLGALGAGRKQIVIERERYGRPLGTVTIELQLGADR